METKDRNNEAQDVRDWYSVFTEGENRRIVFTGVGGRYSAEYDFGTGMFIIYESATLRVVMRESDPTMDEVETMLLNAEAAGRAMSTLIAC